MSYSQASERRRQRIREIVSSKQVSDQKQLVELLAELYGIESNQAVISRDLRKLGIIKKPGEQESFYELPSTDIQVEILKLAVVDIQFNENMIVINTLPALAAFVGDQLDAYDEELEILGCIAGENVVFITPKSIKNIARVYERVCKKMHYKKVL